VVVDGVLDSDRTYLDIGYTARWDIFGYIETGFIGYKDTDTIGKK